MAEKQRCVTPSNLTHTLSHKSRTFLKISASVRLRSGHQPMLSDLNSKCIWANLLSCPSDVIDGVTWSSQIVMRPSLSIASVSHIFDVCDIRLRRFVTSLFKLTGWILKCFSFPLYSSDITNLVRITMRLFVVTVAVRHWPLQKPLRSSQVSNRFCQ